MLQVSVRLPDRCACDGQEPEEPEALSSPSLSPIAADIDPEPCRDLIAGAYRVNSNSIGSKDLADVDPFPEPLPG